MKTTLIAPYKPSGVYVLRLRGKVVYIGCSRNALSRAGQHQDKRFDSVEIFWCGRPQAMRLERKLIREHQPKFNRNLTDNPRAFEVLVKLSNNGNLESPNRLVCQRCKWSWIPRFRKFPKFCPGCKSPTRKNKCSNS